MSHNHNPHRATSDITIRILTEEVERTLVAPLLRAVMAGGGGERDRLRPQGLAAPRDTPDAVIQKLHDSFHEAMMIERVVSTLGKYDQKIDYFCARDDSNAIRATMKHERKLLKSMNLLAKPQSMNPRSAAPPMSTDDSLLNARDLHKSYAGKAALKGVSVSLRPGEMLALLGPNGAGKSTLLQLLTGLFTPDQGDIMVLGHDMRRHPSRALAGLGVVFQQSALDMDRSVLANLLFHTDLHGMPRTLARQRIDERLAAMGIADQASATVRSLSGGTRRKVELARALLHEPRVLLMDEATVGLDPASRQQMLDTVRELCHSQGMAVLWATHLIEEAKVADRLLLLHQGTVRFDGDIENFMQAAQGEDFQTEVLRQLDTRAA